MSILAGRLAATEGAYFLHESKLAAARLSLKSPSPPPPSPPSGTHLADSAADVLPEILRHSIPLKGGPTVIPSDPSPSLTLASKWVLSTTATTAPSSSSSSNPLRAYVSFPQATFGLKRWQLPDQHPEFLASTKNDLRQDRYSSQIDSKKLKALAIGYSQIGKAFALATTIVFGGAASAFVYTVHKLQMESTNDIRSKGKDLIQPGADRLREQMVPLRAWAENMSRKWHIEGGGENKDKSIVKELSKTLGSRSSG